MIFSLELEGTYLDFWFRICGGVLQGANAQAAPQTTICSWDTPFRVGVHFDSDDIVGRKDDNAAFDHLENMVQADGLSGVGYTGFQLDYWQNTCWIIYHIHHLNPIIISYYFNILVKRCNLYVLILNLEFVFCFSLYIIK